ncbi:MAG TPA: hypothetical protein VHP58_06210 [Alphaproteobacteria bacterium]|nr:hypothetical protein [Alphaproteobacteria bacterium]
MIKLLMPLLLAACVAGTAVAEPMQISEPTTTGSAQQAIAGGPDLTLPAGGAMDPVNPMVAGGKDDVSGSIGMPGVAPTMDMGAPVDSGLPEGLPGDMPMGGTDGDNDSAPSSMGK